MVGRLCHSQVANVLWQLGSHQERFLLHLQSRQGFLLHLKSRQAHKLISELTKCGEKLFPSLSMLERFHHGQLGRWAGCGGVGRFLGLRELCTVPFLPPITGHSISALRQQERAAVAPSVSSKVGTDSFCPWGRAGGLVLPKLDLGWSHLLKQSPSQLQVLTTNQLRALSRSSVHSALPGFCF